MTCLALTIADERQPRLARSGPTDFPTSFDLADWCLVWSDDFGYPDADLERNWNSQNGPSGHILCSRWRENAIVRDGALELQNRKETRGGQEWTSGSVWTKRNFRYGYFECRYRYAEATGTNNSFWLMTTGADPTEGKRFEIDINEGHFPNRVNTNIHNWSDRITRADGTITHPKSSRGYTFGIEPDYSVSLESPVMTSRVRFVSNHPSHFHLREFQILAPSEAYPEPLAFAAGGEGGGVTNLAERDDATATSSGGYDGYTNAAFAIDGSLQTSWVSNREGGKWLEIDWEEPVEIGCLQFVSGWRENGKWTSLLSDFKLQWKDDGEWTDIVSVRSQDVANFGSEYHTYGLLWTPDELVFYLDGVELRRVVNEYCHSETPIYLSEAIIKWAGPVTDAIDGTSMKIDWVRYYEPRLPETH